MSPSTSSSVTLKAGVVIVHHGRVVLIKERNNRTGRYAWNIVKGTYDARHDRSIQATAVREAWEEARAKVTLRAFIGTYYLRDRGRGLLLFAFTAHLKNQTFGTAPAWVQRTYRGNEHVTAVRLFSRAELRRLRPQDFIGRRGYLVIQDYLAGYAQPLDRIRTLRSK